MNKEFLNLIKNLKKNKKKISLCHGVFDVVHIGHINHFKSAKKLSDILIVSITKSDFINKGPGRPLFNNSQRLDFLKQIKIIDHVIESNKSSAEDVIKLVKPDFYVKGPDYKLNKNDKTKKIYFEKKLVESFGGKIVYTNDNIFSSSNIINQTNLILNKDQREFISKIKKKFTYNQIHQILLSLKSLKVLVAGDLIFDQYNFGQVIGKSAKEPHLVMKKVNSEIYIGGSGAIARHLATFVKNVSLLAPFGNEQKLKNILNKNCEKNLKVLFFKPHRNFKSIIKHRYVDYISNYKLFGFYELPEELIKNENIFIKKYIYNLKKYDLLLISDYGHKFLSKTILDALKLKSKFTSLNVQINSSNMKEYNFKNYSNFECVVINENELRFEFRNETTNLDSLAKKLIKLKKYKKLIVTSGKNGATMYDKNGRFFYCPAFAMKPIDKVGAGDSLFSIVSLCLSKKIDYDLSMFLGSIAALISVENLGNKVPVTFEKIDRIV